MDHSFYQTRRKNSTCPPSLYSFKKLNFISYMLDTILKYFIFSLHLPCANEQWTIFLTYIKHIPCLHGNLGNENSRIQKKSVTHTMHFRKKAIQPEKVNLFNYMSLLLEENALLLQHIPVHMLWEALQVSGNKQFPAHVPVKWVPLEWLMLESLVVVDSPAVQILYHVLCVSLWSAFENLELQQMIYQKILLHFHQLLNSSDF